MLADDNERLLKEVKRVLDQNWNGHYTQPAPGLYTHQLNWDSEFIAIGYSHYEETGAMEEIRSLFEGQ